MKTYPLPVYAQRFFTERLATQLRASPNTIASYRDTFRLLLRYATDQLAREPTDLQVADIDAELIGLTCGDVALGTGAHVRCLGKERKERATPLRPDCVKALRCWLEERSAADGEPLFVSNRGERLSRDAVERLVQKHVATASKTCPSSSGKRVTAHVLRHSAAMELLQNGVDRTVIAHWLGHESVETTQLYVHANIEMKERAMARTRPVSVPTERYQPDDQLLAFPEAL